VIRDRKSRTSSRVNGTRSSDILPVMQTEALFARHADAWRLYVSGWKPPMLARHLDEYDEAFPVAFGADELETYMWKCDAPYDKHPTLGSLQVTARGRSAVILLAFLEDSITSRQRRPRADEHTASTAGPARRAADLATSDPTG
jgi:hypothetical protein